MSDKLDYIRKEDTNTNLHTEIYIKHDMLFNNLCIFLPKMCGFAIGIPPLLKSIPSRLPF